MKRLRFSIHINAPKKKVWDTMLGSATYRQWTEVFSPGSDFVGDWSEGSKMLFVAPNEEGKTQGMVSTIAESRPYNFISTKHLGIVEDGIEDTTGSVATSWSGALENYTFNEVNGGTELVIDMDSEDKEADMFERLWPQALQKLKKLAEK